MAIDPSIALGVRPPVIAPLQIQSPLEQYGKILSLRNLMTQGQLGQLNVQQTQLENARLQQSAQEEQNLGSWMQQNQGRQDLTPQEIIAANPNAAGVKYATAWSAQQKANMDAHAAALTNHLNNQKAIDREVQGVTDNPTKNAALATAVKNGWLTSDQAAPYLSMDVADPKWKDFTTRVQAQTLDATQRTEAAKKLIDLRIAQATEPAVTQSAIADSAKKRTDAEQSQVAFDAAKLAAAFDQSPETGAAALAALDPARAKPFLNAKTAAQVRQIGLTTHEQAADARAAATAAGATDLTELEIDGKPHKVLVNKQTGEVVRDLGLSGFKPQQVNVNAATGLLDRESARFAKPHEKSVADANSQLEKINEARSMINGPATAQALGIPKVLSSLVGGAGSGLRMTKAELDSIAKARGITGDVEGFINKVSGAGTLTSEQQRQLTGMLDDVAARIVQKQAVANDALDRINSAGSREEIVRIDSEARRKLAGPQNTGTKKAPPVGTLVDGHKFKGGDPNKQENWEEVPR